MDRNQLVALVTQLVLDELSKSEAGAGPGDLAQNANPQRPPQRKVIICGAPGSACEKSAWEALRLLTDTHYIFIDWLGYPWERTPKNGWGAQKCEIMNPPELWDDLVHSADAVILPFAPMDVMAKVAQLIVDTPPVALAVAGLIQGTPVFIGSDDADRWSRHASRIPRAIISVVQDHVRTVQSMGAFVDTPSQIVAHLLGGVACLSANKGAGGRDVVTNEDVMAVVQANKKVLEVMPGSIITSLARETAANFGIEVRFR
ncbi:MAG: hypothetical protein Q4F00_13790 [bacterium]|nr:hypothetical protein [bacterium]